MDQIHLKVKWYLSYDSTHGHIITGFLKPWYVAQSARANIENNCNMEEHLWPVYGRTAAHAIFNELPLSPKERETWINNQRVDFEECINSLKITTEAELKNLMEQ